MKYRKINGGYQVVLEKGDNLLDVLQEVAKKENVRGGLIHGIGAVEDVELGYFNCSSKSYQRKTFAGEFELLNCSGNFSMKDGEYFAHLHVILGDENYNLRGGHLFSAKIAVTGEFFIFNQPEIRRTVNPDFGLALWNLD